ncbi:TetR/AcrR family transcriptional regulator [Nocardioides sp. R-C-SC26]|uniref:TetR/AcrR family transcriptional regulator n=1 Tax=Nocardioides sp. R-C-SC26 TaxID=2870414 RepID=UPI001E49B24E|nr:TetR/AcrR family transcriptional regulator [Nocardioides sp. R-C-SC26]
MSEAPELPRIREGVFFTTPDPLPRGRHGLSRDDVLRAQRERLLIAMTELLAHRGYASFGPAEIAKRAGVSLGAFYDCFPGKQECVFAGYQRFIEVLLGEVLAVDHTVTAEPEERARIVRDLMTAYLRTLRLDLVVARAYQVEIDALGPEARSQRRESLRLFARHLIGIAADFEPDGKPSPLIPESAYLGLVYATRQLASDALDEHAEPDLEALGADLAVWLSDTFRVR